MALVQCVFLTGPMSRTYCTFWSLACTGIPTQCSSSSVCFTAYEAVCGILLYLNKTISNKKQIFVRLQNSGGWKIG